MVLRIAGRKSAKQNQGAATGVEHHVARPRRDQNRITGTDGGRFFVYPSLARAFLYVDDLFHSRMTVGMARPGFSYRDHLHEAKRDALRLKLSVRDQLPKKSAGGLSPGHLTLMNLSDAQGKMEMIGSSFPPLLEQKVSDNVTLCQLQRGFKRRDGHLPPVAACPRVPARAAAGGRTGR